ncbi:hypothetical protein PP568_07080 [Mycobacteroides abscessus]|uniref:Uncharacterized protein n=1 Tax=Mycobacteroides abscessus subsp. abscessus TaxID=1185650 RepID=A0AB38D2K1_9MYCO|nr:hypothetical protein [Mycobacteroides abscessus]MBE5419618.1 hypothetical protein [Mycobacteroides abscessus]MBE5455682.1 hypothetical protein [Mycobacteroides abscessus]MBN7459195.1 hypothetical protein [Mycobacteroides abscessus subsp. abscessus]MBN7555300.1 hypothetical protein [Mycobacteroides abscessus subsp. abscessus]MDM2404695.1 hypothetical protein [Mycobacteroides abscessus]
MGRLRDTTATNVTAGREIQIRLARRIRETEQKAQVLADRLVRGGQPISAEDAADALERLHKADQEIDELLMELVAAGVLEGATTAQAAKLTGIGTATLTRRLPRELTDLRGRNLAPDRKARWRYRATAD